MVKKKGQSYLFTIAINKYKNIEQLSVPVTSAENLKSVLMDKYGFSGENILELHNEEATRQKIMYYLREFSLGLEEEDSLILFYSGHGVIDRWTETGFWLPVDADTENVADWVNNYEIKKYIQHCRAGHVLILCDSFFYGDFLNSYQEKKTISEEMLTNWYVKESRQCIYSGQTPSSLKSFGNGSSFSHAIVESLKENKQKNFIASTLFSHVCARLIEKEISFPSFGTFSKQEGGEYFFITRGGEGHLLESEVISSTNKEIDVIDQKIGNIQEEELSRLQSSIDEVALDESQQGLDKVIKIFKEKEKVENHLLELKEIKKKLYSENTRRIMRVQTQKTEEIQKRLAIEIEKYNLFVSSGLCNEDVKNKAWELVIKQCPDWWRADEIEPHDIAMLVLPPDKRAEENLEKKLIEGGFEFLAKKEYSKTRGCEVREFRHNETGILFTLVPSGSFVMGGSKYSWEKPIRQVSIRPFLISKYLITQDIWEKIMGNNPSFFRGGNHPIESISWDESQVFCKKFNFSLPTESQWEYAARSNSTTEYFWGDVMDETYCWYGDNSDGQTHAVGQKKPNAYGIHDMLGNVWEWCLDTWHSAYTNAPEDDSAWIDEEFPTTRVIRGGSFYYIADFCRSAYRGRVASNRGNRFLGFRVVKNL